MLVPGALMDRGFSCSQHHSALFGAYSILGNENGSGDRCIPSFFAEFIVCKAYCAQLVTDLGFLSACPGNQQLAYAVTVCYRLCLLITDCLMLSIICYCFVSLRQGLTT